MPPSQRQCFSHPHLDGPILQPRLRAAFRRESETLELTGWSVITKLGSRLKSGRRAQVSGIGGWGYEYFHGSYGGRAPAVAAPASAVVVVGSSAGMTVASLGPVPRPVEGVAGVGGVVDSTGVIDSVPVMKTSPGLTSLAGAASCATAPPRAAAKPRRACANETRIV